MSRAHPLRLFMRRSRSSELPAYGALLTAAIVWGGSIVFQKLALDSFSAVEVSVLRGLGALAILIPFWWWQEGGKVTFSAKDLAIFAALGLGLQVLNGAARDAQVQDVPSSGGGILLATFLTIGLAMRIAGGRERNAGTAWVGDAHDLHD